MKLIDIKLTLTIIISLSFLILTGQEIENSKIIIKTDKLTYERGESVEITITNISQDTLFTYTKPYITYRNLNLQRLINDSVKLMNLRFAAGGTRGPSIKPFMPGDTIFYSWTGILADPIIQDEEKVKRVKAPAGVYRFKFNCWEESIKKTQVITDGVMKEIEHIPFNDDYFIYSEKFEYR